MIASSLTPVSSAIAEPFLFGVTASSVSAEGVAPAADWSRSERDRHAPRSSEGAGFAREYRDDLRQFVDLGATDWRLTIEWARVEPEPGHFDSDALDRYRDILSFARGLGLRNWLTLQSSSLPGWYLDDFGGHHDSRARGRSWAAHVDRMASELDEFTDGFVPIDDPVGWAVRGYGLGSRPPYRRDLSVMHEALVGAVLATHEAVRLLSSGRQPVMTAWRAEPVHAIPLEDGRIAPEASRAAKHWDDLLWGTWLRAHGEGILEVHGRARIEVPAFTKGVDYVGIVHDHPVGVDANARFGAWPAGGRRDATGFVPEPDELAEAIHRTIEALPDHRIVVAGHGVSTDDDTWHDHMISRALAHVLDATATAGLVGYFHDSGINGYEWTRGFRGARGLIRRDRSRRPASSCFAAYGAAAATT